MINNKKLSYYMNNLTSIVLFAINTIYCIAIYYVAKKSNNLLDYCLLPFLFLSGVINVAFFFDQNGFNYSWLIITLFFIQSLTLVWSNKYILQAHNPEFDKYMYLSLIFYGIIFICTLFYLQEPCNTDKKDKASKRDGCSVVGWLPFHEHIYKYNYCILALFVLMYDFTVASQYLYLLIPFTKSPLVSKEQLLQYPMRVIYLIIMTTVVWFYTQYTFNINVLDIGKKVVTLSNINEPEKIFSFDKQRITSIIELYYTFVNPELIVKFLYNNWATFTATYGLIILLHR